MNLKAMGVKGLALAAAPMLRYVTNARVCVFMLHRFAVPDLGIHGHSTTALRQCLKDLRRANVAFRSIDEIVELMNTQQRHVLESKPTVAFTVDDGYWDMLDVGAPIFSEFDCPFTGFVVSGIVDSGEYLWWDQLDRMLTQSSRRAIIVEANGQRHAFTWTDETSRAAASSSIAAVLKTLSNADRLSRLEDISQQTDVPLAERAPSAWRVSSWQELQKVERGGLAQFGAHTMSHPILSRCDDVSSAGEIAASVQRVDQELSRPSRVFCYPNGTPSDYGDREIATVKRLGLKGAVSTVHASFRPTKLSEPWEHMRWGVPRIALNERSGGGLRAAFFP